MGSFSTVGGGGAPPPAPLISPVGSLEELEITSTFTVPAGVAYVVWGGRIIVREDGKLIVEGAIGV